MGEVKKLHVGFPECALAKHAKTLCDMGFTLVVVDQVDKKEQ